MNETKHTPGPWTVREVNAPFSVYGIEKIENGLRSKLAWTANDNNICPEHGGNEQSNAKLIAAAPELLEALKGFLEIYYAERGDEPYFKDSTIHDYARKAIAKAEGRTV